MRIIVNIPAFNEEKNIADVIKNIPRRIFDHEVLIQVIDDGSTDSTAEVARKAGADIIVKFKKNRGLGAAFREGLRHALENGADIIVNIDADGQYVPKEIKKLVYPILVGKADIVLGSRFKGVIEYMPFQKRIGNKIATFVTRLIAGVNVSDAQTGFRAFSKEAAMRIFPLSNYTYVQETIIQAAYKGLKIVEVPVTFRRRKGKSRLIKNIFSYAKRAGLILLKYYRNYHPIQFYMFFGLILFIIIMGVALLDFAILSSNAIAELERIIFYKNMAVANLLLFVIFGVTLVVMIFMLGSLGDMLKTQGLLIDEIQYRLSKNFYENRNSLIEKVEVMHKDDLP